MPDYKMNLIHDVERDLVGRIPADVITMVSDTLMMRLQDYSIEKASTEVVPYENQNGVILKRYLACLFVDGKSEKTIYQYKRTCTRLSDFIGKYYTEMGVYDIRYFLASERDRGVSARSCENLRANLSAFFQWMATEELIPKNPCLTIKPIKYSDQVRKPFSDVEIDALRSACASKKERALIEVLLSTGLRVSELAGLTISDIDRQTLSVHVRHGKGDKERVTYITDVAMTHLLSYWSERKEIGTSAFYNYKHAPLNSGGVRFILNKIAKRAGVTNVHPHRFRRTFATNLAVRGMDIQDIQMLLGHTNINTTMEYVYTSTQKTKMSYQKFCNSSV